MLEREGRRDFTENFEFLQLSDFDVTGRVDQVSLAEEQPRMKIMQCPEPWHDLDGPTSTAAARVTRCQSFETGGFRNSISGCSCNPGILYLDSSTLL